MATILHYLSLRLAGRRDADDMELAFHANLLRDAKIEADKALEIAHGWDHAGRLR